MTTEITDSPPANVSFTNFALRVMPVLSTGTFHDSYYRVLEEFTHGKLHKLIITIPPQHGKSLGATTLLPAYMLGLNPELKIAIASYSSSLANRFNKRIQRLIESPAYHTLFPETDIKRSGVRSDYVRTADHVEIIGHGGELISVGREGSLTGNRVDVFILDDLYKDAMEANSPIIRENCWEWYTSVVKTRMHNLSSELIVFTRWHEEDLIGSLIEKEEVVELKSWNQIDTLKPEQWLLLNFEAIKQGQPTEIDPRTEGEPLWEERHNKKLLEEKRKLDPIRFECMYQGHPSAQEGLLYGNRFTTYKELPNDIVRYGNYTDTADMGDDYLCSVCYGVDREGKVYIIDLVYSRESMEITERTVSSMLSANPRYDVLVESNNGGRGFARALTRLCPGLTVNWFTQNANKEARIISSASTVTGNITMPYNWHKRWPDFASHVTNYKRVFRSNRWHDAPDVLTGIIEKEVFSAMSKKIKALSFST